MLKRFQKKARFYSQAFAAAVSAGALGTFLDFLAYRVLGVRWARWKGHDFHRSSLFWFKEGDGIHTRAVFLLPRLRAEYPELKTLDIRLEFYDESGKPVATKEFKRLDVSRFFCIESDRLPAGFDIPKPFSGTLLVKQTLNLDDRTVFRKQGLFHSTHTYLDYFAEGRFVTSLHDYSAYLPDQGVNGVALGMIPAYCDRDRETFLIFHAVKPGIGPKDLRVTLYNQRGEKRTAFFPGLGPFAMRRVPLSELFPDAVSFLVGQVGQVQVRGFLRQLLRRIAFGVQQRNDVSFSLDHCFYSDFETPPPITAQARTKMPKGSFSPFLIVENDRVTSSAIVYHSENEPERTFDVLVYDEPGKCVLRSPREVHSSGNRVRRVDFRTLLEDHGVPVPFVGHAELVFHDDGRSPFHQTWIEHHVEYSVDGKLAHVIHGAEFWNSSERKPNPDYRSGNRIICNAAQTTYLAISNCSYDYDYDLEVHFRLNLLAGDGRVVASGRFKIGPHATIFKPIEYFFPNAAELLKSSNGVGVSVTTEINCDYLTHAFLTQDRRSGVLSVEHSLSMAGD